MTEYILSEKIYTKIGDGMKICDATVRIERDAALKTPLAAQAAKDAEIVRLRESNTRLREALKPFADAYRKSRDGDAWETIIGENDLCRAAEIIEVE